MEQANEGLSLGGLEVDPLTYTASFRGKSLDLSPTEVELLVVLIRRSDVVSSRTELAAEIDRQEGTIDALIGGLRQKAGPEFIRTVHGRGWILNRALLDEGVE